MLCSSGTWRVGVLCHTAQPGMQSRTCDERESSVLKAALPGRRRRRPLSRRRRQRRRGPGGLRRRPRLGCRHNLPQQQCARVAFPIDIQLGSSAASMGTGAHVLARRADVVARAPGGKAGQSSPPTGVGPCAAESARLHRETNTRGGTNSVHQGFGWLAHRRQRQCGPSNAFAAHRGSQVVAPAAIWLQHKVLRATQADSRVRAVG